MDKLQAAIESLTSTVKATPKDFTSRESDEPLYNYMHCGAPVSDLTNAGFDKFKVYNGCRRQIELYDTCRDYLQNIVDGSGRILILTGRPGTGKTFFSLSILKEYCKTVIDRMALTRWVSDADCCKRNKTGKACPFGKCTQGKLMTDRIIEVYGKGAYITSDDLCAKVFLKSEYADNKKFYVDVGLFIVDEVGSSTSMHKKDESKVLFNIIRERYSLGKPVIICSNCGLGELQQILSAQLWSRINSNGIFFETSAIQDMRSVKCQQWLQDNSLFCTPDIARESSHITQARPPTISG